MWEEPNIHFSFTMQKMSCCNSTGLDVLGGYPTAFECLQAVLAKRNEVTSRSIALHFAALALAVLNSFRHHRHFSDPYKTYTYQNTFLRKKGDF